MRSPDIFRSSSSWLLAAALAACCGASLAHEPVARCVLLDAATVRCRGASNDGREQAGARMDVIAHDGTILIEGKLDVRSTLTFRKPKQAFYVLFDTGPGLQITIEQEEISFVPAPARQARWMRR